MVTAEKSMSLDGRDAPETAFRRRIDPNLLAAIGELVLVAAHVEETIRFNVTSETGYVSDADWERFGFLGLKDLIRRFEKIFATRATDAHRFGELVTSVSTRMEMRHSIAHSWAHVGRDRVKFIRPRLLPDGSAQMMVTVDAEGVACNARQLMADCTELMLLVGAWPG